MVPQLLTLASWGSQNSTPATLNITPPIAERLTMMDDEDALVTSVVAFILIGMVLAYMFLCCHVWGIHLRLLQLLKCVNVRSDRWGTPCTYRHSGRVIRRASISLPLSVTQSPAQAAAGAPPTRPPRYYTPPPRYSDAVDSLPSYSCALKRTVVDEGRQVNAAVIELLEHRGTQLALTPLTLLPSLHSSLTPIPPPISPLTSPVSVSPVTSLFPPSAPTAISAAATSQSPTPVLTAVSVASTSLFPTSALAAVSPIAQTPALPTVSGTASSLSPTFTLPAVSAAVSPSSLTPALASVLATALPSSPTLALAVASC